MRSRKVPLEGRKTTIALAFVLLLAGVAQGQIPTWEMAVCADPNSLPFSHQDETGFENRIAEILAEELGAELTYVWWPQGASMISDKLREGECDMIMGVPDGYRELLTTIAYYRSPYAFIYRADSPFDIQSLDDPVLAELDIGVHRTGIPPHEALINRGLADNVVLQYGDLGYGTNERLARIVEAVANREVDVGLAWGPVAGYYAQQQPAELKVVPVVPEIELPNLFMIMSMTIGLRPGDHALRDRLNAALTRRWDEIQEVLRDYGVPLSPLPKPLPSAQQGPLNQPEAAEPMRIGTVIPTRTGATAVRASVYDLVGEAARMGALLAEEDVGTQAESSGVQLHVLMASSPSVEAAYRAGQRLVATEGVHALIGGIGEGQAEALAIVAEENRIPFFNIGSPSLELRGENCNRYTFHIEASAAMYLDALVDWFVSADRHRWFIVYEDSEEGAARQLRALTAIAQHQSSDVVGMAAVAPGQPAYVEELDAARQVDADVILLLLDPLDQIAFLSQKESVGPDVPVAPFPDPVTQTRDYLGAVQYRAKEAGSGIRAALWETTLERHGAGELNSRFMSRWGQPMDPSAWSAYQAISMLFEAAKATGTSEASPLIDFLESPQAIFNVQKGPGVSFRSWDHQLRQPLYLVNIDPEAEWREVLRNKLDFADLVAELPRAYSPEVEPIERLDRLGDGPNESSCHY